MTATINVNELREAIKKVSWVQAKGRPTLPCLSHVHMGFRGGKGTITTSDLERIIQVEVEAKTDNPFTALLPRYKTGVFLRGNGDDNVTITPKGVNVTLEREGLGQATIHGMAPDKFVPIPQDKVEWHELDAKYVCRMAGIVAVACAEEISRPILTGISCEDRAIAAANGFSINVTKSNKLAFGLGKKKIIIPRLTVLTARRLFSKEENVSIGFGSVGDIIQRVYFRAGATTLISQVIQGTFPNYEQLIPVGFTCKVTFSVPLMMQGLQMMDYGSLIGGITRFVFHKTDKSEDICTISGGMEDEADYSLSLPVKIEGEESKIALNYKYMVDAIRPFSVCNMELTSPSSPVKFTGDIEGLTVVVMPIFVQW